MNRKFITTTLPYANSNPHIGHLFEFLIGDALARYFKYRGDDVFFNIGLDEHGLKIQEAAEKSGVTPEEYVDKLCESWKAFIEIFEINSYDNFYRTSDVYHVFKVQIFWKDAVERGDIYKKKYKGIYCVGCESFKTDRELVDGKCSDHPTTELNEIEEENYFFRLSKYQGQLREWANESTKFIEPLSKRVEFLNIIENIQDISISRLKSSVNWGVTVPGDENQTIYVWWDALLNYIFSAHYQSGHPSDFDTIWTDSEVIQICGPDNLKFQSVIFQGLLTAAEIKKTDKLLVHGTILDSNGKKMSKSEGNVVDPIDQLEKYGVEAVRYYALAGLRTYGNSSWDEQQLVELHNSHLADDFGNLVARVTHLAGKFLEEGKDNPNVEIDYSYVEDDHFCSLFNIEVDKVKELWNSYKVSEALELTNKLVKSLNKYINDEQPWKSLESGWPVILELHYAIDKINELYYPVIPGKVGEVRIALRECKKSIIFPKLEIKTEEKC